MKTFLLVLKVARVPITERGNIVGVLLQSFFPDLSESEVGDVQCNILEEVKQALSNDNDNMTPGFSTGEFIQAAKK